MPEFKISIGAQQAMKNIPADKLPVLQAVIDFAWPGVEPYIDRLMAMTIDWLKKKELEIRRENKITPVNRAHNIAHTEAQQMQTDEGLIA